MKSKHHHCEENAESDLSAKEIMASKLLPEEKLVLPCSDDDDVDAANVFEVTTNVVFIDHFRDGSSDSDSRAVLNDDNGTKGGGGGKNDGVVAQQTAQRAVANDMSSSSSYEVKIEEHNFFSGEETTCNFFSDDQAPTLQWYCPGDDQWN